jgi:hypothetical protein
MNAELDKNPGGFRYVTRTTDDLHIPHWKGADIDLDGWRSIPMPPGDQRKEGWKILDRHVFETDWYRICRDYWATARLGAAGRVIARVLHIRASDKPEGWSPMA